ncbi:putative crk-like protein [Apostichopus japonicus]|uniref:Putative crk-like protein n=1 Tax=Stichopus japonicus TaxID=307972 RepID=A0A2G8JL07_STIJA|nr:putative crk-like protein [Apostichopus japonicus]
MMVAMNRWFFGELSRKEADERLLGQEPGLFLVRESTTSTGDFVLSVSENNKVSHYIIEVRNDQYHIGELHFQSLPAVIEFYKVHYLDTTTLSRPCSKTANTSPFSPQTNPPPVSPPSQPHKPDNLSLKYIVKYNFPGEDEEDLPCKKGEILLLVQKEEDNWWKMKNEKGDMGLVPKPYIEQVTQSYGSEYRSIGSSTEPVLAKAVQARIPTPYDYTQLKLDPGDLLRVIQRNTSGQWEGEVVGTGRKGSFPFRCVRILEGSEREEALRKVQNENGLTSTAKDDDVTKQMNGLKVN